MSENPLIVKCLSCGKITEYSIKEQSYCCKACGGKVSAVDSVTNLANWRKQQQNEIREKLRSLPHTITKCPNCGAEFFFKENEVTGKCPYCDTSMVRKEYDESDSFPEIIIPFKITLEEAKEKLLSFLDKSGHSFKKEAEIAKENIMKLQGYYLPYCLIRGPLSYKIIRAHTERIFNCEIFVENNFINASKDLDNIVLDAMEPYDLEEIVPFDFGCIAGQSVKIRDIDEIELFNRAVDEVTFKEKKLIVKELDTEDLQIQSNTTKLLTSPVLLPVYYYKAGNYTISVNGQTGRVSMTNNHETKKLVNYSAWIIFALTFAIIVIISNMLDLGEEANDNFLTRFFVMLKISFLSPAWLPFLLMPKKIKVIREQFPIASEKCLAIRQPDQSLIYKYGNVLNEEIPKPFFWEYSGTERLNLKFMLMNTSFMLNMSFCALFGPSIIPLCITIYQSFIYKNIIPLEYLFSNKTFLIFILFWYLTFGSWFFLTFLIIYRARYDSFIVRKKDYLVLKGSNCLDFVMLFIAIFICVMAGIGSFDIINKGKILAEKAAKEEIKMSAPDLKQNYTRIIDDLNNNKVVFRFDEDKRSYCINFYEKNKLTHTLFTFCFKPNERHYRLSKDDERNFVQLYKVSINSNSFTIRDLNTKDNWHIKYSNNDILIQKVMIEEKTIYSIRLYDNGNSYALFDSDEKLLGKASLNNNRLLVYKENSANNNLAKVAYSIVNSQPRIDGSLLLASPLMLLIDEFPEDLRYIMMLELSQME